MKFVSTKGSITPVIFSESLLMGLAPDGGLLVPEIFPFFSTLELASMTNLSFTELASVIGKKFSEGDELSNEMKAICEDAFNFSIPLKYIKDDTAILELFHGPTCAFKDVGARFLASAISKLQSKKKSTLTVIVATSGDTGGAVASAFYKKPFVDVIVLYPEGKISPRQETQLTCWGENVRSFAVKGDFDDCQRMVKTAFLDPWWKSHKHLISANSISIGRILPQTFYYAWSSLKYLREKGAHPGYIIPSGNLGNATACLWAKKMGFPIGEIILSTNANHALKDYADSGFFKSHDTISTLANAMDVGNPSNIERILNLYPSATSFNKDVKVLIVQDKEIEQIILSGEKSWGEIFCPHTATAVYARELNPSSHWIIVATAHPAKFESIVEPLIGKEIPIPSELLTILDKPSLKTSISPNLDSLKTHISAP